jgi:predicted Zn-dependent protease
MSFEGSALGATANRSTGLISISTGLIERMPTESMMASIVAHELAHLTLDHGNGSIADAFPLPDGEDGRRLLELKNRYETNSYKDSVSAEEQLSLLEQQVALIKKYYSEDEFVNKLEQDADEVGMEIAIRAGLTPEATLGSLRSLIKIEKIDCLLKKNNERGNRSHPSLCWRLKNTNSELAAHAIEYTRLPKYGPFKTSPSLAEAKAEISKAYVQNK